MGRHPPSAPNHLSCDSTRHFVPTPDTCTSCPFHITTFLCTRGNPYFLSTSNELYLFAAPGCAAPERLRAETESTPASPAQRLGSEEADLEDHDSRTSPSSQDDSRKGLIFCQERSRGWARLRIGKRAVSYPVDVPKFISASWPGKPL